MEKAERQEKADFILAIRLLAKQYQLRGDVLNPGSGGPGLLLDALTLYLFVLYFCICFRFGGAA